MPVETKYRRADDNPDLPVPSYETPGSAGMDLRAHAMAGVSGSAAKVGEKIGTVYPGQVAMVRTGFCLALMPGTEGQVRSRSGLAFKSRVMVANSPGTVDSDYRGEVCVLLENRGEVPFPLNRGDRIAQLVVAPVWQAKMVEVTELPESRRGAGGFGSTGTA